MYPWENPARKIFLATLYLWGKLRLRAGEGTGQAYATKKDGTGSPVCFCWPFSGAQDSLSLFGNENEDEAGVGLGEEKHVYLPSVLLWCWAVGNYPFVRK